MGRIGKVTDEEAAGNALVTAYFEGCKELLGRIPNTARTYARLPKIAMWLLPFTAALQREGGGGKLDGRIKELVVLATSMANACNYCVAHNKSLGLATGLTAVEIEDLENDYVASETLSDRDKAAVRWAEAVTRNEAARDKDAFEALKEWYDEDEILELTWVSALFNMFNRVHDSLHIDIEIQREVDLIKRSARVSDVAIAETAARLADVLIKDGKKHGKKERAQSGL
jgi:uncharacterized peroxidase-related enzyme